MPCLADALDLPTDLPTDASGAALALTAGPVIVGYAARFYIAGEPGTVGVGENGEEVRIMPGAFDRAVKHRGIRALFDHQERRALGSVAGGTLRLTLDPNGLRFALTLPPGELGRRVFRAVKAGRVTGASFLGSYTRTVERTEGGRRVVEVHTSTVAEVSITPRPRFAACGAVVATASDDANELALWLAAVANQDRTGR